MCPRWKDQKHINNVQCWTLSGKDLVKVKNQYFDPLIDCPVCGKKFSLQEGLKEAFSSDNPFIIHDFQSNAFEHGMVKIQIGHLKIVKFIEPFDNAPKIYLTPYKKPVAAVPAYVTKDQFSIFSSDSGTGDQTGEIGWGAFGNRNRVPIPIWRELLASSKEHQLRKAFKQEVVDLESAFEVFIGEYLGKNLKGILKDELIDWIFKFSIEEQLRAGFIALTGKPLHNLQPKCYTEWQRNVKELRDGIVHRGSSVNDEQARVAREAAFEIVTRTDPTTINYFAR